MRINPVDGASPVAMVPSAAPPAVNPPAPASPPPDDAQLKAAIAAANEAMASHASAVEFSVDPQRGTTIVRVVDTSTGQVIRQVPSQEMIVIAEAIDQFQGMLIRRKA